MQQALTFTPGSRIAKRWLPILAVALAMPGCAAFHPVRGVPAAFVEQDLLTQPREGSRQIDPSLLVRARPEQHLVEGGDVLSIFVPRVLGSLSTEVNEVGINPPINIPASADDPPTVGFPIQVRDDHTISLPQIPPLNVRGMTLYQVEQAIRQAYTVDHQILRPEEAMVLVSLYRPREYRVLIFRQEFGQEVQGNQGAGSIDLGKARKGTARQVRLKAGENDVAHALTLAGVDGLPGNDAENAIYIIRHPKNRDRTAGMSNRSSGTLQPQFDPASGPGMMQPPGYGQPQFSAPHIHSQPQPSYAVPQPAPMQSIQHMAPRPNPYGTIEQMSYEVPETDNVDRADYSYDSAASAAQSRLQLMQHSFGASPQRSSAYGAPDLDSVDRAPAAGSSYPMPRLGPSQTISGFPLPRNSLGEHSQHPQPVYNPGSPGTLTPGVVPANDVQQALAPFAQVNAGQAARQQVAPVQFAQPQAPYQQHYVDQYQVAPQSQYQSMPQQQSSQRLQPIPMEGSVMAGNGESVGLADPMWGQFLNEFDPTIDNPNVIKIPVRLQPGEPVSFSEADITLYDGDIVFIESRQTEVFYAGGLLGGGQYPIPRDYDLHVLEAISIAESRSGQQSSQSLRAIGGVSALNQDVGGSASRVLILRKLPNGQRARIEVNIYKAIACDDENILIQPGDMLVLQYTFPEACAAFTQRFLLEGALIGIATSTFTGGGGG